MSLFPRRYSFNSEKNGAITVREFLGYVSVTVDGYEQTGAYLRRMLRGALRKIPARAAPAHILMVGLGGGGAIPFLEKRFPEARITVVEWDPVMADIARTFARWKTEPEITIGDMFEVLPQFFAKGMRFDFVIVDVFYGGTPDQRLAEERHAQTVSDILAPGGYALLNAFKNENFIAAFQKNLSLVSSWRYQYNTLALFIKR